MPTLHQPDWVAKDKKLGFAHWVFVGRISPVKNLTYLLERLAETAQHHRLDLIGPQEDAAYWQQCEALIARLPARVEVRYLGTLPHHEIMARLPQYHGYALTTFGENFGHSIFEAFLAGLPALISDQTPWRDLRAQSVGWDLPLAEPAAFVAALDQLALMEQAEYDRWSKAAWGYAAAFIQDPKLVAQSLGLFDGDPG